MEADVAFYLFLGAQQLDSKIKGITVVTFLHKGVFLKHVQLQLGGVSNAVLQW